MAEEKVVSKKVEKKEQTPKKEDLRKSESYQGKEKKGVSKVGAKQEAIANVYSARISLKHAKYIGKMIKGKTPEQATRMLENVVKQKQPVKMTGREVPHQKGRGVAGARYPKNAAILMKELVNQLSANAQHNGIEDAIITIVMANKASEPARRGGRRGKRTHVYMQAKSKAKLVKENKK